jgi:hypothetical protein
MRVNLKGRDQVALARRGERISPAGTFESSPLQSGGKGVKDSSVPEAEGTIESSVVGSHTASRTQAANRSSLAGRVAFEKNATHHFVVGYFQMSLRDEVLPECFLALS